ncbi:MAG: pitrilysin family protein [Clostridia bacterium]
MNNIHVINDNKFKSIYLSYNFTFPIKKEEVSTSVVTSLVLSKGCEKYKTSKEIEEYLNELYGTNFDVNIEKIGDLLNIEFRIECVNKKFLPNNEDIVLKAINLLYEIIYKPNYINSSFNKDIFEREKSFVIEKIQTRKDEKLRYAVLKTEELLCKNEPFGTYVYGNLEDAKNVTLTDVNNKYIDMLENSSIAVIVSGNLNGYENIQNDITNIFNDKLNSKFEINQLINQNKTIKKDKIEEVVEKVQTNQAVITVGMKVSDLKYEDFYALNVYNSILGGTPSSKLFQNVREKESLAYTTKSRYYRFKGIYIIYAGIEEKNFEKAKQVILEQINDMKNCNITSEEILAAKESLTSDLLEWKDSKISLAKLEYTNALDCTNLTVDDIIYGINKITIKDVEEVANRINVELIYLLGGEEFGK